MDWSSFGQQALQSGLTQTGNGVLGFANSAWTAKKNWKFYKKQLALSQQYAKQAFDWENERQDYLIRNMPSMTKEALRAAGYSTADPNGTGVQTPSTPNVENAQAASGNMYPTPPGFGIQYSDLVNAELAEYQKSLLKEQAGKTQTEAEKARTEIKVMSDKLEHEIDLLIAKFGLTEEQAALARKEQMKLDELVNGIRIDNQYKPDLYQSQINEFNARAAKELEDKNYQAYVNGLAKFGIFLNTDALTNFMSVVLQHPDTAGLLVDGFAAALASATGATTDLLKAVLVEPVKKIVEKVKGSAHRVANDTNKIVGNNAGMPLTR